MFWDLAGQVSFDKLRKNFYNGTSAAIIVFSHEIDTELGEKSFKNIIKWSGDVRKYSEDIPIILFGNKIDLIDIKDLENSNDLLRSNTNISELVRDFNFFGYYKTSALSGEGVTGAFKAITNELVQNNK